MPIEFTDQQKKVINHDHNKDGVVRAGPGTGKSATVVALAQRLKQDHPELKIKFLTFTRAATAELVGKMSVEEGLDIKPSTIHSFATSILMQNQDALPVQLPLRIPTDYETKKIIYPYIARLMGIKVGRVKDLVNAMSSMWESLEDDFTIENITPEEKARFISAFQKAVRLFGFTLLSQLPDLLRRLLNDHPDIEGVDIDFMIIDEFQDLNKCEIELLKLLHSKGTKILAVGDEDQSIYSFRMAHPKGIREFENHFPGAVSYDLSICHRCPSNLLLWAQHVIQGDLGRSSRPLPESKSQNNAETKLLSFAGDASESKGIADFIEKIIKRISPHEVLVLTRSDNNEKFSKKIKEKLAGKNIKTFDPKDLNKEIDSKDTIKLFAYLRLLDDEKDSLAWFTVLNESRGIGVKTLKKFIQDAEGKNTKFGNVIMEEMGKDDPGVLFKKIKEDISVIKEKYEKVRELENIEWGKWIVSIILPILKFNLSEKFTNILKDIDVQIENDNRISLGYFLSQVVPVSKDISNEQKEGVRFMTMQSSKGLTAKATIVIGVDGDLIPSQRNSNNPDEERRLLYVAMTRSQEMLVMTWARRRRGPQARSGTVNLVRRNYTPFLIGGPINSEDGDQYINGL